MRGGLTILPIHMVGKFELSKQKKKLRVGRVGWGVGGGGEGAGGVEDVGGGEGQTYYVAKSDARKILSSEAKKIVGGGGGWWGWGVGMCGGEGADLLYCQVRCQKI